MPQNKNKTGYDAVIFGSVGTVGIRVIEELISSGFQVHAVTNNLGGSRGLEEWFANDFIVGNIVYYRNINAYMFDDFLKFEEEFNQLHGRPISCVVFCLALGPQNGFMEEVPLDVQNASDAMWDGIVDQYVHYFSRVIAYLTPLLDTVCDIVFVTSGIADLESKKCPPWLTSDIYQRGKTRLDSFIQSIRSMVDFKGRVVSIHRIGISSQYYLMGMLIPCAKLSSLQMPMDGLTRALQEVIWGEVEVDYDFVSEFSPSLVTDHE